MPRIFLTESVAQMQRTLLELNEIITYLRFELSLAKTENDRFSVLLKIQSRESLKREIEENIKLLKTK